MGALLAFPCVYPHKRKRERERERKKERPAAQTLDVFETPLDAFGCLAPCC